MLDQASEATRVGGIDCVTGSTQTKRCDYGVRPDTSCAREELAIDLKDHLAVGVGLHQVTISTIVSVRPMCACWPGPNFSGG